MSVDQLREIFHSIAGVLVLPVLVGMLLLAAWVLFSLGTFAREWLSRGRGQRSSLQCERESLHEIERRVADKNELELELEEVLMTAQRRRARVLTRTKIAIRLGPSLGLMGTLIPMADALQGLAEGNMPALASNMVTAFAATVIGLSISVIAYLMTAVREGWMRADSDSLDLFAERLLLSRSVDGAHSL